MNKLDEGGYLVLDRFGFERLQYCPYHGSGRACGIWCPLFGCTEYTNDGATILLCDNVARYFSKEEFINEFAGGTR
jgi:Zn-finger protein